jgi:N-acetylglutamate synthase-like GNAT family acetyltransferase
MNTDNRKATSSDIPEIKLLWEEVFGDFDDYISRFIAHFGIETCYVCEANHKIVATAFALPTTLTTQISNLKSHYLYACATHEQHRNQGVMEKLLATIFEEGCKENVAGIFLHAANQYVASYYRKLGFKDFFFRDHFWYFKEKILSQEIRLSDSIHFIAPEIFHKHRVQKLENHCFVNWSEDFFRFFNEAKIQFCEYEDSLFSFKTVYNNIIVDELWGDISHEKIARALFEHLPDFETVCIRTMGNDMCCGQIKWCKSFETEIDKGYFAFAME